MITGKTTIIGSMPQKTAAEALTVIDKHPLTIPAWPQLPRRSFKEAMIPQYSEGFPGIVVDETQKRIWVQMNNQLIDSMTGFFENVVAENLDAFAVSQEYAAGLYAFLEQYGTEKLSLAKGQLTGPFTFGLGLNDQEKKAVWFDEQYRDVVVNGLRMKALWQVRELKHIADKVIIFFDEPILSALGTPAYISIRDEDVISVLNELAECLHEAGALVGVHCCGNMDWGLLTKTKLDIIAFDAYFYGDKLALYPDELNAFLKRGGYLAWGIVPTGDVEKLRNETRETQKQKIAELKKLFIEKNMDRDLVESRILFTPSCGMGSGSLNENDSELVLKLLAEITQ
ncbi:MAG: hypothetical protein JW822_03185 [Spirochaetales bacterium]|nr:hypothetical protein [Spirochaetales bacterium]